MTAKIQEAQDQVAVPQMLRLLQQFQSGLGNLGVNQGQGQPGLLGET